MAAIYPTRPVTFAKAEFHETNALGISNLDGPIGAASVVILIDDATDHTTWPAANFVVRIDTELIFVTSRTGNELTLAGAGDRGFNGTTAAAHLDGAEIRVVLSSALIDQLEDEIIALQSWAGVAASMIHDTVATTPYTALSTDFFIPVDATGAAATVNLPDAGTIEGRTYCVVKVDATANTVTIDGDGADTIDGAATKVLRNQYESAYLIAFNGNWISLSQSSIGGSGVANQVAYWSGTRTLAGDAGMTYDPATDKLSLGALAVTNDPEWLSGTAFKGTLAHANTADRTYTFQDASGTLAFLTDISGGVDVQLFTASDTWTKPAGAKWCRIICVAGGGGGAGGGRAATAGSKRGGGGGGGASIVTRDIDADDLGATETVTIGAGGTGGAGQAGVAAFGAAGAIGGNTTFGSHVTAYGGGVQAAGNEDNSGGGGGIAGAGVAGTTGGAPQQAGLTGRDRIGGGGAPGGGSDQPGGSSDYGGGSGSSGTNNIEGVAAGGSFYGAGGGGGGGGGGTSGNNRAGGTGGKHGALWATGGGGAGGAAGPNNGTNGTSRSGTGKCGDGGGGGGADGGATGGGDGGDGGAPGGGGGGGGTTNSTNSANPGGDGGDGGRGECIVITW